MTKVNFDERFGAMFQALQSGMQTASHPAVGTVDLAAANPDVFAMLAAGLGQPNLVGGRLAVGRPRLKDGYGNTVQRFRARKRADRERCIAILDTETDPFDRDTKAIVFPFLAVLYSDQFEPIIMWENDHDKLVQRILSEIRQLPEPYTIYAHNGGKFDYMFFIEQLRGHVSFKGRGVMRATIVGRNGATHEIRDSMHIIPQPLAGWKKDTFDYEKNLKRNREKFKAEIIQYCINDCKYLLQIVRKFIERNGIKLSIGQAARSGVKEEYQCDNIGELMDAKLRGVGYDYYDRDNYGRTNGTGYFYGGRVECFRGAGVFNGPLYSIDVNSMYPAVMAFHRHPVGANYIFRRGVPDNFTCFVHIHCRNNGALVKRNEIGETTTRIERGEFFTTIWEFETALELGLISDVRIIQCVDCDNFTDFSRFVLPRYESRRVAKAQLEDFHRRGITEKSNHLEYDDIKLTDTVVKFELNNAFGKFAQNPRRYSEHYFCDAEGYPDDNFDWGPAPKFKSEDKNYAIWERKAYQWNEDQGRYIWDRPPRFYNVGTGASITGCARAVLMRAIHCVRGVVYCDTDSLVCRDVGSLEIDATKLGAWKLEKTYDEFVVAGKKEYAAKVAGLPDGHKDRIIVKSKGVDGVTYAEMVRLAGGEEITKRLKAPTMTRYGDYDYIDRTIRATVPVMEREEHGFRI